MVKVFQTSLMLMLVLSTLGSSRVNDQPQTGALDRVAVFDFRVTSGVTTQVAVTLTNQFRSELAKTGKFALVERSAMDAVMSEQRFSVSDLADQRQVVELGRMLAANIVIVGDIGQVGRTYSVTVRMIDVNTSTIVKTEDFRYQGELDGMLNEFEILAKKLAGTYVEKKKKTWLYIVSLGIVGGAAGAYYMLNSDAGPSGLPLPPPPPAN